MNRSLRLVRPSALSRPLASSSALARASFLSSKSASILGSGSSSSGGVLGLSARTSAPPTSFTPRFLGIRLYVTPSGPVAADTNKGKDTIVDAVKEKAGAVKDQAQDVAGQVKQQVKQVRDRVSDAATERSAIASAIAEARDVVGDLASIIGGNQRPPTPTAFSGTSGAVTPGSTKGGAMAAMETSSHSHGGNAMEDFASITTGLIQTVPRHVMLFGLAGTIPYLATSIGTIFLSREANLVGNGYNNVLGLNYDTALEALHTIEAVQITYGAVILSFLGALHWGMEFVGFGGEQGFRRLAVGTFPLLLAWPSTFLAHGLALGVQWIGFTMTWFLDQRATSNGWTPPWFATYRFYLSIIVGFSIIGTLAGTSYYQEGAGSGYIEGQSPDGPDSLSKMSTPWMSAKDKAKSRSLNTTAKGAAGGPRRRQIAGDIELVEEEGLEAYTRLRNKAKEAEEDEEEEEEGEGEGGEEGGADEASGEEEGGEDGDDGDKPKKDDNKGAAGEKNTGLR